MKCGTTFTHAHIFGSEQPAVCAPSRAMLMTGKVFYSLPKELYSPQPKHAADTTPAYVTMPEYFRQHGYYTYMTGKWHNSRRSFHKSFDGAENISSAACISKKTAAIRCPRCIVTRQRASTPPHCRSKEKNFPAFCMPMPAFNFCKAIDRINPSFYMPRLLRRTTRGNRIDLLKKNTVRKILTFLPTSVRNIHLITAS